MINLVVMQIRLICSIFLLIFHGLDLLLSGTISWQLIDSYQRLVHTHTPSPYYIEQTYYLARQISDTISQIPYNLYPLLRHDNSDYPGHFVHKHYLDQLLYDTTLLPLQNLFAHHDH